ncbi:hypothetical protein ACH5RR_037200 [Cinchona calisaya]|uniref:Reverse transcriptase zinc-binding domain-containing protein n=1 Tax=Cinchona calisaya TaxID=153742 RepID=A0ABD2Y7Q7_9GENT
MKLMNHVGISQHLGFSLSSAFHLVCTKCNTMRPSAFSSGSRIPIKYSILAWKGLNGLLPFDDVLLKLSFHLASKYCYCKSSDTIDHFFIECPVAMRIWEVLESWLGIPRVRASSFQQKLNVWCLHSLASLNGQLVGIIPILVCWHLWGARSAYVFYSKPIFVHQLMSNIRYSLHIFSLERPFEAKEVHHHHLHASYVKIISPTSLAPIRVV